MDEGLLVHAASAQYPRSKPLALAQDTQQQVLRAHIAVSQLSGGEAGVFYGQLRPLGKSLVAPDMAYPLKRIESLSSRAPQKQRETGGSGRCAALKNASVKAIIPNSGYLYYLIKIGLLFVEDVLQYFSE